jgi:formylmethanofuran--tetrahydromethanopterin N-formyltransferase
VIDGLTLEAVERATALGIRAGAVPGVVQITAGNYGGKLGPFHIKLQDVLDRY